MAKTTSKKKPAEPLSPLTAELAEIMTEILGSPNDPATEPKQTEAFYGLVCAFVDYEAAYGCTASQSPAISALLTAYALRRFNWAAASPTR
jgi:hypothetical protein